jgi:hypothetical protein
MAIVLALACQIASGGQAGASGGAVSALDAATIFCQAGHGNRDRDLPPLRHRLGDAAILQDSAADHAHAIVLDTAPFLPVLALGDGTRIGLPEARAPPAWRVANFEPTGPPRLV